MTNKILLVLLVVVGAVIVGSSTSTFAQDATQSPNTTDTTTNTTTTGPTTTDTTIIGQAADIPPPSCPGTSSTTGYFLKIDGITGESADSKHKCEIDILSFSWGESHTGSVGSGGGGGAGKVNMQDIHFTMKYNSASPQLFLDVASGKHIKTVVLTIRKAGAAQQEYLKYTFTDVLVSEYQTGGTAPDVPVDEFSLNFAKIQVEYKPQKADGTLGAVIKAGWDIKNNKKI